MDSHLLIALFPVALLLALALYLARLLARERARSDTLRSERETLRCELQGANTAVQLNGQQLARVGADLERSEHELRGLRDTSRAELEAQRQLSETKRTQIAQAHALLEQRVAALTSGFEAQARELEERNRELASTRTELRQAGTELRGAAEREARLATQVEEERRSAGEKLQMTHDLHQQLEEKFKGIAAQVLERNTEKFESTTKLRLGEMSDALRGHVKELQDKVASTHEHDSRDRVALRTELQRMVEASKRIDADALNLTRALKGDRRAQGAWGELVLESILQQCGLREGEEYRKQASFTDEDSKRLRPDVIVQLPGGRSVVVDSKVSLTAYTDYVSAPDDAAAEQALARHLLSVRNHIKQLSEREYWRLNELDSCDYVLMFVPVESAFADAVRNDRTLFEEAFAKRIILTAPTTLLATLRTIEHTWRVERYNDNARKIVEEAGNLYDKFAGFVGDIEDVGKQLRGATESFEAAKSKLSTGRGNLVRRVENLRALGAKVKRELPRLLLEDATAGLSEGVAAVDPDLGAVQCVVSTALADAGRTLPEATASAARGEP